MVYVPNWFSVDLKTGVSHTPGNTTFVFVLFSGFKVVQWHSPFCLVLTRCSLSLWMRVTASLLGCLQRMLGFPALMALTQSVSMQICKHIFIYK